MELKIYSRVGTLRMTVSPSDSSTHVHELMGENVVNASFTWPEYMQLDVNDYIELDGQRYAIRSAYQPTQKSTLEYTYNVKFYGRESETQRVKMLYLTDGNFEPKFSLDGSPAEHLQKVIDNLNRISGTNTWVLGSVISAPNQNIEYNNVFCSEALSLISEAFETEWWIEGNTLNLSRCEYGDLIELGYMKGLTELNREENANDVKFFTRLIPLGTTRNIDRKTYGFSRLQLPDRAKYVEQNTEYGLYEAVEEEAFSAIYPKRIGKVSSIRSEEKTGEDKQKFTIYYFADTTLNFNPNDYDMEGLVKHVVFQSGELNGRDFEVNYNATKKEFEIITQFPDESSQLPGGHLVPGIGDEYILYNLKMPTEYITAAEQEYKKAVDAYLAKFSVDSAIYRGNTDYIHISEKNLTLRVGRRVRLLSDKFFPATGYRDSRITKITRKLNNPAQATIECTNAVGKGRLATIESNMNEIKSVVADRLDNVVLNMLRTWDSGDPTDYNLFSSLRALKEIKQRSLSRLTDDDAKGIITFLKGALFGNYSSGPMGAGACISIDPETGQSYLEVDKALFRMKAIFTQLVIDELAHVGGSSIWSPARMKCVRVEERADAYRCYFMATDEDKTITNNFVVNDQAQKIEFNIKPGVHENVSNRYYWRLVTAVGDDYLDLSKTDCDADSDIPEAGDEICQLGHRTDKDRQNAIIISSYGPDAPSLKQYAGINSYSLAGKEVTSLSPDNNSFTGKVTVKPGSSGYGNLTDKPDLDAINDTVKDTIAHNLGYTDFEAMVAAATAGKTIISGGSINTELIQAAIIVTSKMIADAIQANSLNINNRFKVSETGIVELMDAIVSGRIRSSDTGARVEIDPEKGSVSMLEDDWEFGSLGWNEEGLAFKLTTPVVNQKARNTFLYPSRLWLQHTDFSESIVESLIIDSRNISGVLYADENGFVRVGGPEHDSPDNPIYYYTVSLVASPEEGGVLSGGGRRLKGTTSTVTATANKEYRFREWSDGNIEASRSVTWDVKEKTLTAYFDKVTYYSIGLSVSPEIGGTVSGGGRFEINTNQLVKAIPNSGYIFSRWSDGNTESSRTIKMTGDVSLIAYFTEQPNQETKWLADFQGNMNARLVGKQSIYHSALLNATREHVFDYVNNGGFIMYERRLPSNSSAFIISGNFIAYMQKSSDGNYRVWTANYPISANRYKVVVKVSTSTMNETGIMAVVNGIECTSKAFADKFYDVLTIDGAYSCIISTYDYNKGGKLISIQCGDTQLNFVDKNLAWTGFPSAYGDIVFSLENITVDELIKQETVDMV